MPALALAVLGLLLALVSVALHSGTSGTGSSLHVFWSRDTSRRRTRGPAKASDTAAAVGDGRGVGQPDGGRHRRLFGWGGGGGRDGNAEPRRARLAFLVMSSGDDIGKLELLLPEIYHPDNMYLVHVDAKTPPEQVRKPISPNPVASSWYWRL